MTPNGDRVTKGREGDMVHEIELLGLMQARDDFPGRALPQNVIEFHGLPPALHVQQRNPTIVIDEAWQGLAATERFKCGLDGRAIVGSCQDGDVVKVCHLEGPLPAYFGFGPFPGLAGIGGKQNFKPSRHGCSH